MRFERIMAALFAVGVGGIPFLATVSAESLQNPSHHRKRQRALTNNGIDPFITLPRARDLGIDSIEYGPKKAKSDKGSSSSSSKSEGNDKYEEDDDDKYESGGKGRAPAREDKRPKQHEQPDAKETKREKKPKYESRKDKESKLEKSSKTSPTYKPIPAPSIDGKSKKDEKIDSTSSVNVTDIFLVSSPSCSFTRAHQRPVNRCTNTSCSWTHIATCK